MNQPSTRSALLTLGLAILPLGVATAQTPHGQGLCGTAVVAGYGRVQILDLAGRVTGKVTTAGYPGVLVHDVGPRILVTDQTGTRIFDAAGRQKGKLVQPTGATQTVFGAGERLLVVDYDRLRIFDLEGQQRGSDIMRTGKIRQWGTAAGNHIVVIDDDRVRFFTNAGKATGKSYLRSGAQRQLVTTAIGLVVITDLVGCILCKNDGTKIRTVKNGGATRQRITFKDGTVVVTDDRDTRISKPGGFGPDVIVQKTGKNRQAVVVCGDAIIIIDDDRVRIFGKDGVVRGAPITNTGKGRQTVTTTGDRVIVTDDKQTEIFDKRTGLIQGAPIKRTGTDRQTVRAQGDRIVVTDQDRVRVFDRTGTRIGLPIPRKGNETQRVHLGGGKIVVIDGNTVRIFDAKRKQVGSDIPIKNLMPSGVQIRGKTLGVTDDNGVRLFDLDTGKQKGKTRKVTSGVQHLQFLPNRIVLADTGSVKLLDHTGAQIGTTLAWSGDPEITVLQWIAGGFRSIGVGCGGMKQSALGKPSTPGLLTYQLTGAPAYATVTMNIGFTSMMLDLAVINAKGCFAYNDIQVQMQAKSTKEGFAQIQLPVPYSKDLIGLVGYTQFMAPDSSANGLGLVTSNGMETRIGTQL